MTCDGTRNGAAEVTVREPGRGLCTVNLARRSGGPATPDRVGSAVVGHGIGQTKSASLRQAALLHEAGYGVVLYDHRNHGRSGRDAVRLGMADRFTLDVRAAATFARDHFRDDRPVLAYGFSFSSFPSVYVLRDSTAIGAVICDSGPSADLGTLIDAFARTGALPLPPWLVSTAWGRAVMAACAGRAVDLLDGEWPPPASQGVLDRTPILFLVGADDALVTAEQVQDVADRYGRARCVVLDGTHLDAVKRDAESYRATVTAFLASWRAER